MIVVSKDLDGRLENVWHKLQNILGSQWSMSQCELDEKCIKFFESAILKERVAKYINDREHEHELQVRLYNQEQQMIMNPDYDGGF
jgi:hypothetical protein